VLPDVEEALRDISRERGPVLGEVALTTVVVEDFSCELNSVDRDVLLDLKTPGLVYLIEFTKNGERARW
jgi:hypothetical protein